MPILAFIAKPEDLALVLPWTVEFAAARHSPLQVVCWKKSVVIASPHKAPRDPEHADTLTEQAYTAIDGLLEDVPGEDARIAREHIEVLQAENPEATGAALKAIQASKCELIVTAAEDQTGGSGATFRSNRLLKQSPCNTIVLYRARKKNGRGRRILVAASDNPNDAAAVSLATRMVRSERDHVTIAHFEPGDTEEGLEVGRRELRRLMRESGAKRSESIHAIVMQEGGSKETVDRIRKQDLILMGANNQRGVMNVLQRTDRPTVAVIKRAPPLRPWRLGKFGANWNPMLTPGDYAGLVQNLRRGSRLSADFLIMLGLAAIIASMGLLQDSPAVVIGSMLLAPLMTPMIGSGLALAQANMRLGKQAASTLR